MGYEADGKLEDFFHPEPMIECARRTTERVGADLKDRVAHHTPVAKPPSGSVAAEWEAARKRIPGTLKESWQIGEVTVTSNGARLTIPVFTDDPVAPYVEWDTQPHLIVPKDQLTGVLRYWDTSGNIVFAQVVHHPGTKGAHMMATALTEVAATWFAIGSDEFRRWENEQLKGVA
jgi:hypothetical protein